MALEREMDLERDYGPKSEYIDEETSVDDWEHDKCVCHNCQSRNVVTNGEIHDCTRCEWWKPVSENKVR